MTAEMGLLEFIEGVDDTKQISLFKSRFASQIDNYRTTHVDNGGQGKDRQVTDRKALGRFIGAAIILLIAGFFVGYSLGWHWQDDLLQALIADRNQSMRDIRGLTNAIQEKSKQIDTLTDQLKTAQSKLGEFLRSERQLNLEVNHAEPISIDTFKVALIKLEKSSVTLNVDGKLQDIAAGSAVNLTFTSNCRVEVESFEVSSATIGTSCSRTHP